MNRVIPVFRTEAEEARWWDEHLDEVEKDLADALDAGSIQVLTGEALNRRVRSSVTVELAQGDVERARELARQNGLDYRAYLAKLLHNALDFEGKNSHG